MMSKRSQALISTDREVAAAKLPPQGRKAAEYRISGTPNLVLRVMPTGRRSWVYWVKRPKTGRWAKFHIGSYPIVGFARAKDEALRLRRAVIDGVDPFDLREVGHDVLTVKTLGETFITRHAKPQKRSWAEDERTLEHDIVPALGNVRADLVTKPDVVRMLDAITDRGAPIQANRCLSLIRKLFNWAAAEGYISTANPAQGIPKRAREVVRKRTLTEDEMRAFWRALDGPGFDTVTADALRLQLLLGARILEITGMARSELELEADVPLWTLPAARSKGNRDVPRPLPPMALAIIRERINASRSAFVFASPINAVQPILRGAPTKALKRAADRGMIPSGFTPHDLRRTCRTNWARLGIAETVAKKLLGHVPPKSDVTAAVYDQHDYLSEMQAALALWEDRLIKIVSAQVPAAVRASASVAFSPRALS